MYNFIMALLILLFSFYCLYNKKPSVNNHVKWTPCNVQECQQRQGKINYE